ncbi:hypothetical protein ASPZODRAFT_860971 [Penicilliopsis zonata CBS 506.65]|uniref:Uncharacterized protein n=1 Tax=Penicilliopsis zonata CBS 506.65 TaxID=1073090 RepID=A0A1L9S9A0_9EURO|nr:hypothetical protein ASPZODRAFT_860971 [Penicilliopsis zonata CBS 506.65]OJJ43741.1 hypothetical protein ASPZODRAFT_860971 [Penicilliopsis zonata CBS 506.65]
MPQIPFRYPQKMGSLSRTPRNRRTFCRSDPKSNRRGGESEREEYRRRTSFRNQVRSSSTGQLTERIGWHEEIRTHWVESIPLLGTDLLDQTIWQSKLALPFPQRIETVGLLLLQTNTTVL